MNTVKEMENAFEYKLVQDIANVTRQRQENPLLIYLHIPFCASKCLFCDWVDKIPVKQLVSNRGMRNQYVEALCNQIRHYGPELMRIGYKPKYIYWGGGTPTRLDPEELFQIMAAVEESFDLSELVQHTMESTPNEMTAEKLEAIQSLGVNRISFGIQSFDPYQLRTAGRAHSEEQAKDAVRRVVASDIEDVNIDLISGFPGEATERFQYTLEQTVSLEPTHVSVYSYRATPSTMMAMQIKRGSKLALTLKEMVQSYELAQQVLGESEYDEYCYNYFAKSEAFHFKAGIFGYSLEGDTIGFGAGANSIIGHHVLRNDKDRMHQFVENPLHFNVCKKIELGDTTALIDLLGSGLLTGEGLNKKRLENICGIHYDEIKAAPDMKAWFRFINNCGTNLEENDEILRIKKEIKHDVYLSYLYYSLNSNFAESGAPLVM